jgi:hypothetical protein
MATLIAVPGHTHTDDGCHSRACLQRTCRTATCHARVTAKYWQRLQAELQPSVKAMLLRLRSCETRGLRFPANYRYAGAHDGAFQYDAATWHQAGGTGRAFQASPAEQNVRTARFFPSHRSQWACSA